MKSKLIFLSIVFSVAFALPGFPGEKGGNLNGDEVTSIINRSLVENSCPEQPTRSLVCEHIYRKELRILQNDFLTDPYLSQEEELYKTHCCKEKRDPRREAGDDVI